MRTVLTRTRWSKTDGPGGEERVVRRPEADRRRRSGPSVYARKFSGPYAHRSIQGGVGHNLPQEVPRAFAQAIVDVAGD